MDTRDAAFTRLEAVIRRLFQQLRALAERASPADDGVTASHRAVLEALSANGPQTVPAIARERFVARQHIQSLVDDLLERRLVTTVANPAHKRSPLVALTEKGIARFELIREREKELLRTMRLPLTVAAMNALSAQLEALSDALRSHDAASRSDDD